MLGEQLFMSLKVIVLGMGTVFIALVALIYVIELVNKVLNIDLKLVNKQDSQDKNNIKALGGDDEEISTELNDNEIPQELNDEEIVAVITAAIAASLNRSTHDIVVKSVKRVPFHAPAWNRASRNQQIATRL